MDYADEPGVGIKHKPEIANPATARNHEIRAYQLNGASLQKVTQRQRILFAKLALEHPIFCKRFREVELVTCAK